MGGSAVDDSSGDQTVLVLFAAEEPRALQAQIERYEARPTRQTTPPSGTERLAVVASRRELHERLALARERLSRPDGRVLSIRRKGIHFGSGDTAGRIAFVFPGQGSQHAGMLRQLHDRLPLVRTWFSTLDDVYQRIAGTGPATRLIYDPVATDPEIERERERALFDLGQGSQLGTVACLALVEVMARLGIRPDVVVGHSNGEHAAIVAGGMLPGEDARARRICEGLCRLALPGPRPESPPEPEGMLAVSGLAPDDLESLIARAPGALFLAMDNCPRQQVLSGVRVAVQWAAREAVERGGLAVTLPFARAYHSPLFADWARRLAAYYDQLPLVPPRIPVYSCLDSRPLSSDPAQARAHMARQWTAPVHFRRTVLALHDEGVRTFVEVGPGDTLTAFVQDTLFGRPHLAASASSRGTDDVRRLHHLLAELFAHGVAIDLGSLDGLSISGVAAAILAEHERLVERARGGLARAQARTGRGWFVSKRRFTRVGDPLLADHSLGRRALRRPDMFPLAVVPFTVSLELVAEAASAAAGRAATAVANLRAHQWLALDGGSRTVAIEASRRAGAIHVQILDLDATHAPQTPGPAFEGMAEVTSRSDFADRRVWSDPAPGRPPVSWTASSFYERYAFHGPTLRSLSRVLAVGPRGIEAELVVPARTGLFDPGSLVFDPGTLDAAGQLVAFWLLEEKGLEPAFGIFPFALARAQAYQPPPASGSRLLVRGQIALVGGAMTEASFSFRTPAGEPVVSLEGLSQRLVWLPSALARRMLAGEPADLSEPIRAERAARIVNRLSVGRWDLLLDPRGIWQRALAHVALDEREFDTWSRHSPNSADRALWLLERVVAKEAVRRHAAAHGARQLDLAEIGFSDLWHAQAAALGSAPVRVELRRDPDAIEAEVLP